MSFLTVSQRKSIDFKQAPCFAYVLSDKFWIGQKKLHVNDTALTVVANNATVFTLQKGAMCIIPERDSSLENISIANV